MSSTPKFMILIFIFSIVSLGYGVRQASQCAGLDEDVTILQSYWLEDARFIEGLFYDTPSNRYFESYGLPGESGIRSYILDDEEQEVSDIQTLYNNPTAEFAEGIAVIGTTLYQLTYRTGNIHVFDDYTQDQLIETANMAMPRDADCLVPEGWGLTSDDTYLYMTDGTARVFRINPVDLQPFDQAEFDTAYGPGE